MSKKLKIESDVAVSVDFPEKDLLELFRNDGSDYVGLGVWEYKPGLRNESMWSQIYLRAADLRKLAAAANEYANELENEK